MTSIATLGPKGTFSHQATSKAFTTENIRFENTIRDIFRSVDEGLTEYGVVPIENSLSGTIGHTVDLFLDFDVNIVKEILLPVHHNLAAKKQLALDKISRIYTHPVTYEQCESFIQKNCPEAEIMLTSSNSMSAEKLFRSKLEDIAAIIPDFSAKLYSLHVLKTSIQDSRNNVTRFIVISKAHTASTKSDRTSILVYPQIDKPGLLFSMLKIFAELNINLTKIESRPSKGKLGDYIFYIEFQGHKDDANVKKALDNIKKHFFVRIAGSYKRVY